MCNDTVCTPRASASKRSEQGIRCSVPAKGMMCPRLSFLCLLPSLMHFTIPRHRGPRIRTKQTRYVNCICILGRCCCACATRCLSHFAEISISGFCASFIPHTPLVSRLSYMVAIVFYLPRCYFLNSRDHHASTVANLASGFFGQDNSLLARSLTQRLRIHCAWTESSPLS